MCGISGIYRFDDRPIEPTVAERMQRATAHRGPDDQGILIDGRVALIHNRLSILDLSPAGHQPMRDDASGHWIVYNGEVYNFAEIRRDLEDLGHAFRSHCDTEVLLAAYRQWGDEFLSRLNGMFAFAIYDPRRQRMFLARDRIGIKPLYYYVDRRQFVFASETKAILLADGVERRIDRDALPELLAFRYLVGGRTMLQGIHELPPGWCIDVSPDGIKTREYWDIPSADASDNTSERGSASRNGVRGLEDWIEGFADRLKKSVAYQLIADVPVGCALSGGIDSSVVTAVACRQASSVMKTFSIGFDAPSFDERPHARTVADVLGVENYSEALGQELFYDLLPKLTWHMDEPINHPNSAGIWLLAKIARDKVTVLLSGEGADELLAGYPRFRSIPKLRRVEWVPGSRGIAGMFARSVTKGRVGHALRLLSLDEDGRIIWSSACTPPRYLEDMLGRDASARAEAPRRKVLASAPVGDITSRQIYYELKTYLVSLLIRVDKMCMAHSLENRVPLLDHTLVEYAARMPTACKTDAQQGKLVLRHLLRRVFDERTYDALFNRPKMGFGLPTDYFRGSGLARLRELVTSTSFRQRELVDPGGVERMLADHESGRADLSAAIWPLATLEIWARTFIDRPGIP